MEFTTINYVPVKNNSKPKPKSNKQNTKNPDNKNKQTKPNPPLQQGKDSNLHKIIWDNLGIQKKRSVNKGKLFHMHRIQENEILFGILTQKTLLVWPHLL